ncbi:unnamed protein product [Haemonchus placei]|uniref:Leucine Rich repeat-containing domain protein n=1 Tax=Haemonchus placei TaxID=6290 RepID=A0A0N4XAB0_HAEPC|nr:unnamed protein product [Haemonchus placei]
MAASFVNASCFARIPINAYSSGLESSCICRSKPFSENNEWLFTAAGKIAWKDFFEIGFTFWDGEHYSFQGNIEVHWLLQALSMEGQDMGQDAPTICFAISCNPALTRLDLSMTMGINAACARLISKGCVILQHFNLSWSSLDQEAVLAFCSNLPSTVTRLNMAGTLNKSALDDNAVERLTASCPNLKELDLSDNIVVTERGLQALNSLPQLESLSLNRCYGIPPMNFLLCGHLCVLNVFGCITDSGLIALRNGLADTEVNGNVFNYIAKPTVPPAVTSIWGQRTKDFY